jgi:hypothetical protein
MSQRQYSLVVLAFCLAGIGIIGLIAWATQPRDPGIEVVQHDCFIYDEVYRCLEMRGNEPWLLEYDDDGKVIHELLLPGYTPDEEARVGMKGARASGETTRLDKVQG